MIAVVIGSVIMLGAATLFLQSKISYVQDEELARLQEGGRYAMRYLTRELSMSGFYGGVLRGSDIAFGSIDPNSPNCYSYMFRVEEKLEYISDAASADFSSIRMPEGSVSDTNNCLDASELQPGADILVLRRVKDSATVVQGEANGASIGSNTVYLELEDYNVSILFTTATQPVATDIDLWEYAPQIVYVRNYAITAGDGIPTLCRRGISPTSAAMADAQCMVQGVEDMHIEFGLDTDDDYVVDTYSTDPSDLDLPTALSAKVYLLLRSPNEVTGYTNNKRFLLGSKPVPAVDDGYFRRVIQSTVILRNSDALGI
jgi:Tfp pilus assembly protein PilW